MAEENESKINEIVDDVKEKVQEVVEEVKEKVDEFKENAPEMKEEFNKKVEEVKEDVKEAFDNAKEKAQDVLGDIKEQIDDYTAEQDPEDVSKNKVMAVLAYIGILVLIPLFAAKDSKFARFHTNQGLVLCIINIICSALVKVKIIGWIFGIISFAAWVLAIVGIIYACQGKAKELPVIGNIKILK